MTMSRYSILIYITTLLVFITSLILSYAYTNGDQLYYIKVYNEIQNFDFVESFGFYRASLSSSELIHFLLVWIFSFFHIEKIIFVALFNSILAYSTMIFLKKLQVSIYVTMALVLTNFYFLVLYFSAERLKFGVLFFVLSLIYFDKPKFFISFLSIAFLSHVQMIIVYLSILFNYFLNSLYKVFKTKKISKIILYFIPILTAVSIILYPQILLKFNSYNNLIVFYSFWKITLFFALALYYSNKKTETTFLFIPLFIAILFVGDIRINMFAYFVFLYYALQVNNGFNFGILITTLYFAFESVFFVINIFNYVDGFYAFGIL